MRFKTCPECGSCRYQNVSPESAHFVYDRICRDCETRYTPPTPSWMAAIAIGAGCSILAFSAMLVFLAIRDSASELLEFSDLLNVVMAVGFFVVIGATAIMAGIRQFVSEKTGVVEDLAEPVEHFTQENDER